GMFGCRCLLNAANVGETLIVFNHLADIIHAAVPRAADVSKWIGFSVIPDNAQRLSPESISNLLSLMNPTRQTSMKISHLVDRQPKTGHHRGVKRVVL